MKKLLSILPAILVIALIVTVVVMAMKLNSADYTTVAAKRTEWEIGALNEEDGLKVNEATKCRTKSMNGVDGATIKCDKDANLTYQIFFYDKDGKFVEASEVIVPDGEVYVLTPTNENSRKFKVVITPNPTLVNGEAEYTKLDAGTFGNMKYYVEQLTISISKTQKK